MNNSFHTDDRTTATDQLESVSRGWPSDTKARLLPTKDKCN